MKNFRRVLRLSLRYRWTAIGSVACALIVGALWGGNIAALYPVVEAVLQGDSLQTWVDREIDESEQRIAEFDRETAEWNDKAQQDSEQAAQSRLAGIAARRQAEVEALGYREWLRPYIYAYMPATAFGTLVAIISVVLVGTLLKDVFIVLGAILVDRQSHLATFDLRKQFYRRTLRLDLGSFNENSTSELMSRFTYDLDSLNAGLQALLGRAVREPLKMIVCLAMAGWICWRLLLLSLIVAPLAGFLIGKLGKSLKRANRRAMEEMSQLYSLLSETFVGIKVVKAFTMERHERRRFHHNSKKFFRKAMKISGYDALVHPLIEVMGIAIICLAFIAGAYLVLNQETHLFGIKMSDRPLSQGTLLVFYGLLIGASDPARKLSEVYNRIQRAAAASDRIFQLLDREPAVKDPAKPRSLGRHCHELRLDNVNFAYRTGDAVMQEVSLRIPFGETLAIVGPNGCGKSTLVNLLPRFYDPTAGSVLLDGIDLREVRLRDLRSQIGIVTQETLLFDDTVLNNIRYGCPEATREQVVEAAKQAHAHRFITERLEDGYDTVVGPQGNRLSGGQRQRIALARAILRDPAILILDEATSQVDLESEQLIHMALEKVRRGRTTIMITHRLSTLDLADRVLVMDAGRVLDIGTHDELTARCEFYRRLYQIYFKESA